MNFSQALFSVFQFTPFFFFQQHKASPSLDISSRYISCLPSLPVFLNLLHFLVHNEFTFNCIFQVLFLSNMTREISLLYN